MIKFWREQWKFDSKFIQEKLTLWIGVYKLKEKNWLKYAGERKLIWICWTGTETCSRTMWRCKGLHSYWAVVINVTMKCLFNCNLKKPWLEISYKLNKVWNLPTNL